MVPVEDETVCEMPIAVKKKRCSEHRVRGYFIQEKLVKFWLPRSGMMGWNEVLECNVGKDVALPTKLEERARRNKATYVDIMC